MRWSESDELEGGRGEILGLQDEREMSGETGGEFGWDGGREIRRFECITVRQIC